MDKAIEFLKRKNVNICVLLVIAACMGAISFCVIFGVRVLEVGYTDWLFAGEDLTQHFLGWEFFRHSPWNFPLGLMDGAIYPEKISVIYTDSIPLFAIFFKLFSPFLSKSFQYFGLWGIICYILQGIISAIIFRYYTSNNKLCLLATAFFLLSTTVMQRMYLHTSLAGQWLVLAGLGLFIYRKRLTVRQKLLCWSIIGFLNVTVHPYFVFMNMAFLLSTILADFIEKRDWRKSIIVVPLYCLVVLAAMYILGAFYNGNIYKAGGVGEFGSNLLAFFSPVGYSSIIPVKSLYPNEWGGSAYLGMGMFGILIASIYGIFSKRNSQGKFLNEEKGFVWGSFGVAVIFMWLAFFPVVILNGEIIYKVSYPPILVKLLAPIRATGRFIWPVMYLIMLFGLMGVMKKFPSRVAIRILLVCLLIQIVDLHAIINEKHQYFSQEQKIKPMLQDEVWEKIGEDFTHIVFLPKAVHGAKKEEYELDRYALSHGMTINDFYLARKPNLQKYRDKNIQLIKNEMADENTLFVINDEKFSESLVGKLNFYRVDGVLFGVKKEQKYLLEYKFTY